MHLSAWTVQRSPYTPSYHGVQFWGTLGLYSCRAMERQKSLDHLEGKWLTLLPLALL